MNPPVPVVPPVPSPVRLNQVSIVNWPRSSSVAFPKDTYAPAVPRSSALLPGPGCGVALASFEAVDGLPESSTATTT